MSTPSTEPVRTVATLTTVPIPMNKPGLRSWAGHADRPWRITALQVTPEGLLFARGRAYPSVAVHLGGGPDLEVTVAAAVGVRDAQRGDAAALVALWREMTTG